MTVPAKKILAHAAAGLTVVLITVFVYGPGLSGGFMFDDEPNIVRNHLVHVDALNIDTLGTAATSGISGPLKRPVSMVTFALDYYLHGLDPYGYKVTNLLIHLLTGFGLAFLTHLILRGPVLRHTPESIKSSLVMFVPAIWLLHPIQLTTVLYVVQRMNSLSALFMVAGAICYVFGRLKLLTEGASSGWFWIIAGLCLGTIIATLSKENGALLPLYVFAIEYFLFRFKTAVRSGQIVLVALLTFVFIVPVTGAVWYLGHHPHWLADAFANRDFDWQDRLLTQARVVLLYLRMILLPDISLMGLHLDDFEISRSLSQPWTTLPSVLTVLCLLFASVALRRRAPVIGFGIAWFFAGHLLESTILPLEIAHEHRNYLPSFGIVLAVVWLALTLLTRTGFRLAQTGVGALALLLAVATHVRAGDWSSPARLVRSEAIHHPRSPRSQYLYGIYAMRAAQRATDNEVKALNIDQAYQAFRRTIDLKPNAGNAAVGLFCLSFNSRHIGLDKAEQTLVTVIRTPPLAVSTVSALEWFTQCAGQAQELVSEHRFLSVMSAALDVTLNWPEQHALTLSQIATYYGRYKHDLSTAVRYAERVRNTTPEQAGAHLILARWYTANRQFDKALKTISTGEQKDRFGAYRKDFSELRAIVTELERNPAARLKLY